jgi:hypothetical protein
MLTPTEQARQERLELLLAHKRAELPGNDYFATVLPEFHRRQRAAMLQPRSAIANWLEQMYENWLAPLPALRYASVLAVAVVGLGMALTHSWNDTRSADISLTLQTEQRISPNTFAFAQAFDEMGASRSDQQLDAATLGKSGGSYGELPHYVLASGPTGSDSNLAF